MSEINVNRDSKLIKVLAAQVNNQRVDSDKTEEAAQIISELAQDLNPQNMHQIGQIVAYTVDELQSKSLDFLNLVADIKNIGYGDKAAFKTRTGGIKAVIQAKGATAPRSYVADSQILVDTKEIAARPAINIVDLRTGRVQMSELIRQANVAMTNKKIAMVESVLHDSIDNFSTPFYATSSGTFNPATLDAQINYFRRLGPVTLLGDLAAVGQLANYTGMAVSSTGVQFSGGMIEENNNNGFIGKYKACDVIAMTNAYEEGSTTPILATNWIYIIPGGQSAEMRNLKIVNEGPVNSMASQNIDDRTYEILLDQWFGVAFVVGKLPTSGAHYIG
ncbi:MAG: hypothetical protein J6Y78_16250 [Paludibacteraceae bacterium]|nr:hypothetical protein [Paludibacteraceae bacterium]